MTPFKERMNLYRTYRELNPDKNYWDWKASIDNAGKLAQQFRTRTNKPNFVQRLEDSNRQTIPSWEDDTSVATHRLSYTTYDDGSAVIYPEVQQIGTKLYDFTDPTNRQTWKDAYQSALNRGDVVWVPTEQDAVDFTTQYKNYYPTFPNGSQQVPAMLGGGENKPLQDPRIKTITFSDGSAVQTVLPWANQQGLLNTPIADMFNPVNDVYDVIQVGKDAIEGNWADVGAGLVLAAMPKWMEKVGDAVKPYYRLLHKKASLKFGAPNVEFYENLVRDVMTRPTLTIQARREGRYPLTYQERRDYLENAHFHGDRAQNAVISNTLNALDQRQMLESGIHVDTHPFAVDAIAKYAGAYTFNGRSYLNFSDRSSSIGVSYYPYWNIPNHVSLRRNRHSNILPNISAKQDKDLWALDEVVGHEITHGMMARSGLHNDLAQHGGMLLLLDSDDAWQQLPTEVHAELNGMRGALGLPRFSQMSQTRRDKFAKVFSERFNISLDAAKDVLEMADKF